MTTIYDAIRDAQGTPLSADEAYELITGRTTIVDGGGTILPSQETINLCIMQTVNLYHALTTGELPKGMSDLCEQANFSYRQIDEVDPVIEGALVSLNDAMGSNTTRAKLLPLIPKLLNTKVSEDTSERVRVARRTLQEKIDTEYDEWLKQYEDTKDPVPRTPIMSYCNYNWEVSPTYKDWDEPSQTCVPVVMVLDSYKESVLSHFESENTVAERYVIALAWWGDEHAPEDKRGDAAIEFIEFLLDVRA